MNSDVEAELDRMSQREEGRGHARTWREAFAEAAESEGGSGILMIGCPGCDHLARIVAIDVAIDPESIVEPTGILLGCDHRFGLIDRSLRIDDVQSEEGEE